MLKWKGHRVVNAKGSGHKAKSQVRPREVEIKYKVRPKNRLIFLKHK